MKTEQSISTMVNFPGADNEFEVRSLDAESINREDVQTPGWHLLKYLIFGMLFGVILVKSEVMSWFRIQEMFRLQQFHMYGVIGSAVAVGLVSVLLIKKFQVRTIYGEPIRFRRKAFSKAQVIGGMIFGTGWALTGACPGPLYALVGSGATVMVVALVSAIAGTWVYGRFRNQIPH